jgi:hypothetical protein
MAKDVGNELALLPKHHLPATWYSFAAEKR